MKYFYLLLLILSSHFASAQDLYFPPLSGNTWDTMAPGRLGWCPNRIDSLYNYLERTNTKAFIILKDGRVVLEQYFGSFTADSSWYWASAGKSLSAMLAGIAQQEGLMQLQHSVTSYIGPGWSVAPPAKEAAITIKQLLNMTSGLNDNPPAPCNSLSTPAACLQYLADTASRWGYHTGAYLQVHKVMEAKSGQSINQYTQSAIGNRIGMPGIWINGVFVSKARAMARFGLLTLARGRWGSDTLLSDTAYYRQMVTPSQPFNLSYGYLWWLNGQPSYMVPGVQLVIPRPFITSAPLDMFAALGLNDQKIYVVPSQNLVVIRMGNSAYDVSAALSKYDDTLWQYINALPKECQYRFTGNGQFTEVANWHYATVPPPSLPAGHVIIIGGGGECILNREQVIGSGASITVEPGAKLRITGSLLRQ